MRTCDTHQLCFPDNKECGKCLFEKQAKTYVKKSSSTKPSRSSSSRSRSRGSRGSHNRSYSVSSSDSSSDYSSDSSSDSYSDSSSDSYSDSSDYSSDCSTSCSESDYSRSRSPPKKKRKTGSSKKSSKKEKRSSKGRLTLECLTVAELTQELQWFDHRRNPNKPPSGYSRYTKDELMSEVYSRCRKHHKPVLTIIKRYVKK